MSTPGTVAGHGTCLCCAREQQRSCIAQAYRADDGRLPPCPQPPLRTLQSALGATLAALPFWEQDAALGSRVVEIANQCAAMLRELGERGMLEVTAGVVELGLIVGMCAKQTHLCMLPVHPQAPPAALTALAESLASTHHLSPSFAAIHRAWSAHASAVRTTEDALRSLLVLQHYVSVPELIRRDVFLALGAESQGARYCPGPGDQVAVAITGAAAHVAHFLDNIPAGHALLRRLQDMLQAGEYAGIYRVALVAFYGGLKSGNILTDRRAAKGIWKSCPRFRCRAMTSSYTMLG